MEDDDGEVRLEIFSTVDLWFWLELECIEFLVILFMNKSFAYSINCMTLYVWYALIDITSMIL